ncbi:MAG TPA: biopolymer transporter ExbD [Tepidisphaeraceae bacterium]|nr:biopolymer transporter ExbD [Tepidisphaeraceae bacterium]
MTFDASQPEDEAEDLLNLTSMIDVVFTLLAFFIITVRIFGIERDAAIGAAQRAQAGLAKGDLPDAVLVRLLDKPQPAANGDAERRMTIEIGGHQFTEPAAVTKQLSEINLPDVPVVVASAPNLTVEQVTGVVDAALHSPMRKVSLRQLTADELAPGAR